MRRLIAVLVVVAALAGLAVVVASPAVAEPEAVELTAETAAVAVVAVVAAAAPTAWEICRVIQVATPLPGTGIAYSGYMSFYGLTYVRCCFYNLRTGQRIMALYLVGWGDLTFPQNDPWCR